MWLVAADAGANGSNELIVAVFVFLGVVVTAAGGVVVALINSRADRTAPSPPAPITSAAVDLIEVRERVRVLEYRAEDKDERDDIQDRRLDQLEDILDTDNPRWSHLRDRRDPRHE